jgi:hypothetical protein
MLWAGGPSRVLRSHRLQRGGCKGAGILLRTGCPGRWRSGRAACAQARSPAQFARVCSKGRFERQHSARSHIHGATLCARARDLAWNPNAARASGLVSYAGAAAFFLAAWREGGSAARRGASASVPRAGAARRPLHPGGRKGAAGIPMRSTHRLLDHVCCSSQSSGRRAGQSATRGALRAGHCRFLQKFQSTAVSRTPELKEGGPSRCDRATPAPH